LTVVEDVPDLQPEVIDLRDRVTADLDVPITVIRANRRAPLLPVGELRERRELLAFLVWRDLKIRYKQTVLGAVWAVLQPVSAMVIFAVFFGRLARVGSEGVPYWLFALAGLVPWIYFSNALSQSSLSLVDNERVIAKIYFPRFLLPTSPVVSGLFDLAIATALLLGLALVAEGWPSWHLLALPAFVALAAAAALGLGLLLSCLNVRYRDVRYVLPFLIQLLMFASPVVYSSQLVPEQWSTWYSLNPLVTVIDGFRWSVLGAPPPAAAGVAASVAAAALLVLAGSWAFHRAERSFADVL
jgi:lipopolysaccharide transport system permease protein